MKAFNTKTECDRCGTCCTKGGPALHIEDKLLLHNKLLKSEHLITIRKGEPVFSPASENPEPAESEIVKIKGKGREWTCFFYIDQDDRCAIYAHRPIECSLLKCWDTADLENVAGKDLLSRFDIIDQDDPLLPFIKDHEKKCSLENLGALLSRLQDDNTKMQALNKLTGLVNTDLILRTKACKKLHLSLQLELFFFGRPLFKILEELGITMHSQNGVYRLSC